MIPRYEIPEISAIFSDEGKYKTWLEVELAAGVAMAELGLVPAEAIQTCRERAVIEPKRIEEIEQTTRHDVIAFLEHLAELIGPEARYLHLGMTSSDVLDTALALQMTRAQKVLADDLDKLIGALARQACKFQDTPCIGRSHGVHAEPTTFGLKLATFYSQLRRDRDRLSAAVEGLRVGQISGAVGAYTTLSPEVEERTCAKLGLKPSDISTQVLQRDRHAAYLCCMAILGADLERLAVEIRHLQRTEVGEIFEPFTKGQKGSSAMPHKKNPIVTERITGMARLLRANAHAALENIALWHERDISHSSVERVIIPDSFHLAVYMLRKMSFVVRGLVVDGERMAENLALTKGLTASSVILVELIRAGLERKEAYEVIQKHAVDAWEGKKDFRESLENDPVVTKHLNRETIERCFDPKPRYVDETFRRLGLMEG